MLPETIYVKGPGEEAAPAPLASLLEFKTGQRNRLKTIHEFKSAATKQLKKWGGK